MRLRRLSFNWRCVLEVGLNAGYQCLAYPAGRPFAIPPVHVQVTLLANFLKVLPIFDCTGLPIASCSGYGGQAGIPKGTREIGRRSDPRGRDGCHITIYYEELGREFRLLDQRVHVAVC